MQAVCLLLWGSLETWAIFGARKVWANRKWVGGSEQRWMDEGWGAPEKASSIPGARRGWDIVTGLSHFLGFFSGAPFAS